MAESVTDKQRAARAEKQVERLERELELVKSRMKKPTGSGSPVRETDKLNFQLQEQVKDLKHQLKSQQAEHSKIQETLTTKTNEYETKLKRMREIFGQATKNIDNYRASIASKDTELEKLRAELEECQVREQTFKATSESQQLTIEKLNTEVTSSKTFYGSEIKQLEAKNRQLVSQNEQTKSNYEQYKKRAHVLLEKLKEPKSDSTRLGELEDTVQQLQSQKAKYELEQHEKAEQQILLEHDLRKAIDRINELESIQNMLSKEKDIKENLLSELRVSSVNQKKKLELELRSVNSTLIKTTQQLEALQIKYNELEASQIVDDTEETPSSQQLDEVTEKLIELKVLVHELEETNESLNQQIAAKDKEIAKLLESTPKSPPPADETFDSTPPSHSGSYSPTGSDVYASVTSLLSPLVSRPAPDEKLTGLQKQIQHLSEMLQESEEEVIVLKNQEKILKDELRKIDAVEKRQDMNVEYLKNVLVKFLMSDNKQAMVPILAKLLYLDETETDSLRESCI